MTAKTDQVIEADFAVVSLVPVANWPNLSVIHGTKRKINKTNNDRPGDDGSV